MSENSSSGTTRKREGQAIVESQTTPPSLWKITLGGVWVGNAVGETELVVISQVNPGCEELSNPPVTQLRNTDKLSDNPPSYSCSLHTGSEQFFERGSAWRVTALSPSSMRTLSTGETGSPETVYEPLLGGWSVSLPIHRCEWLSIPIFTQRIITDGQSDNLPSRQRSLYTNSDRSDGGVEA